MKVFALIMAGGSGTRMGAVKAKQSLELAGKKIFKITTEKLNSFDCIEGIVFVGRNDDLEEYRSELSALEKVVSIVEGGLTRSESVYNGLMELERYSPDIVVIHDAVRPFIDESIVARSIEAAEKSGASVVAAFCTDTVAKTENGFVEKVYKRDILRNLQTPQTFRFEVIKKGHEHIRKKNIAVTDDTGAVMETGVKVKIVEGSPGNIKITSPADMELAKILMKE